MRQRSADKLNAAARDLCGNTGYEEVSLTSLSTSDHSQLEQLLARVQGEICYRATPLGDLLEQLKVEQAFPLLELGRCTSLRRLELPAALTLAERQALQGFFDALGQATGEESARQGAYYQKRCAELLEEAQRQAHTAEELYTKLGLCAGALLALLLL